MDIRYYGRQSRPRSPVRRSTGERGRHHGGRGHHNGRRDRDRRRRSATREHKRSSRNQALQREPV